MEMNSLLMVVAVILGVIAFANLALGALKWLEDWFFGID